MTGVHQLLTSTGRAQTVLQILQANSATSGLVLCLDAGDSNSYAGGTTWLDVSGGGNNYFLGATSSVEASDPTHVGGTGNPAAYFQLNSLGFFTATAAQTFADNFHKNNGVFSFLVIYYPRAFNTSSGSVPFWANRLSTAAEAGIQFDGITLVDGSQRVRHSLTTTTSTLEVSLLTANTAALAEWNFALLSADEASTSLLQKINNTTQLSLSGFSASTDTDASSTLPRICAETSGNPPDTNNSRIAALVIWNRVVGLTEANTLYTAFKSRWTTFPLEAMHRNNASGTVTIPSGATQCVVEAWGGGGGGGAENSTASGGGSGGGYCKITRAVLAGEWGSNLSYTRGSRGNGGTGNANGAAGTASTVTGTLNGGAISLNAPGGNGGLQGGNGGAASATPTGGDTNTASAAGGNPAGVSGGAGSTAGPLSIPAPGGVVLLDNGTAQFSFGGGGGGGAEDGNGGNGADGSFMFTFY